MDDRKRRGAVVDDRTNANRDPMTGAPKAAAEGVNPTVEDEYWRANYATRPYVMDGADYDVYRPAYRYGWESPRRYPGRTFDDVEDDLRSGWEGSRENSRLSWDSAKDAVRDGWHRVDRAIPGDADLDGR